ncbi:hypothetical protein [Hymenobacter koreensis]|uniref:Bacterial toxin 23 domain-containing protein n=1 Tax=Hymenobacter koreensis TaxID=1084523 RepID=A0ABP8IY17_9BACT
MQLLLGLGCLRAQAQYEVRDVVSTTSLQLGASLLATLEFQRGAPHLRLGFNAGAGAPAFERLLYPTLNLEWQLYGGGIGTQSGARSGRWFSSDLIGALTLTSGQGYAFRERRNAELRVRNRPLYYFTDLVYPALQNPYAYSASVGTVLLLAGDARKSRRQRIGYLGVQGGGAFLGYYNDGGGMQNLGLGDGEDRYFTGGGFLGLSLPRTRELDHVLLSYHKFSGYSPNAFEVASDLDQGFVNYKDAQQEYFNKSYLNVTAGSVRRGWTGFWRINNPYNRVDVQNTIHYVGYDAYHHIPYPRYPSFGGSYVGARTSIGIQ